MLANLARYTHRVAISNSRLIALDERGVTFSWKDYRARRATAGDGWVKTMTLPADEFLRRLLLHVLPDGFHRIRHYGLLASGQRLANVSRARELLGPAQDPDPPAATILAPAPILVDPAPSEDPPCPCCGGRMRVIETFLRGHAPRTVMPTPIRIDTSRARHRRPPTRPPPPAHRRLPPRDRLLARPATAPARLQWPLAEGVQKAGCSAPSTSWTPRL